MEKLPLIHPRFADSIERTWLARDVSLPISRADGSYDTEGNYTGVETTVTTIDGSLGLPTFEDLQIAASRGYVVSAVLVTTPTSGAFIHVGDNLEIRGKKYVVEDTFIQIISVSHLREVSI